MNGGSRRLTVGQDDAVERANQAEEDMRRLRAEASQTAASEMLLDNERSRSIIAAFKPPR